MVKPKKDPLASPGRRTRAYELPNLVNVQSSQDPLREIEDDAIRDLSSEYRQLRVEEMIAKKKLQLEKISSTSGSSMPIRQIEDDALKDLSSEYRQLRVEEMIQKKKRQLEKSTPTSDISMQKQNLDLVTTIFKLVKETQPQQSKDDTLAYVTLFKDLMMESVKIQNQGGRGPSFFESMITDPNLYQRTKDIFGSGSGAKTTNIDLEIEKLRGERQLSMKKMDLDMQKSMMERELSDRRTENLIAVFAPFAGALAGAGEQRMRELGRQTAAHNPMGPITMPQVPSVQLKCSCGYEGVVPVTDPPQTSVNCPQCNVALTVKMPDGSPVEDDM